MDFTLSPDIESYRQRYKAFVAEHLLPLEADPASFDDDENIRLDLLDTMRANIQGYLNHQYTSTLSPNTLGP